MEVMENWMRAGGNQTSGGGAGPTSQNVAGISAGTSGTSEPPRASGGLPGNQQGEQGRVAPPVGPGPAPRCVVRQVKEMPVRPPTILLCGHSMIFWAGRRVATSHWGTQLALSRHAKVEWLGRRGLHWDGLLPLLSGSSGGRAEPGVLVLHLGGNDLGLLKGLALVAQAGEDLKVLRKWWPSTRLVWSWILPRKVWRFAQHPRAIDKQRIQVNKEIGKLILAEGGFIIRHPDIRIHIPDLYRPDGVHLTDVGNDIFLTDLQRGLLELVQA
ncbi:uncharacterized protein [Erythrolamprus reginae]|uniref:uncharacterized protein n=1 Tax=Erythrolamprus reginae TaxID=121349 RepID=UPI00396C9E1E